MTAMRKIAKIIQSGKTSPRVYIDRDIVASIYEAIDDALPADCHVVGHAPEAEAYEVWLVPKDELSWTECNELLPIGEYIKPVMATRPEGNIEGEYIYQPLLTGRRVQIHKNNNVVKVFDHKGREMTGTLTIEDEKYDLSMLFLEIITMEEPMVAILDAVILSSNDRLVVTDVLRWEDIDARNVDAIGRMSILTSTEWGGSYIEVASHSYDRAEIDGDALARPAGEGYFSDWLILVEED